MTQKESFEDIYRDTWILMSYLKVHLKNMGKAREMKPDEKKHLRLLRFVHHELYKTVCETAGLTQKESHETQTDYAECMKDTQAFLLALVLIVEKVSDEEKQNPETPERYAEIKKIRDRIYKAVKKVDKKIEKSNNVNGEET